MRRLRRSPQNEYESGRVYNGEKEFAYRAVSRHVLGASILTIILVVLFVLTQYLWRSETLYEKVDQ